MRCGPRTVKYVYRRCSGSELTDEEADKLCLLNGDGTSPDGIKHALVSLGFQKVNVLHDYDLDVVQSFIEAGFVVIAFVCESGPDSGHILALHHAFHEEGRTVFVWDSDTGYREVPRLAWDTHWYDYEVRDGVYVLHNRCVVVGYWPPDGCKPVT